MVRSLLNGCGGPWGRPTRIWAIADRAESEARRFVKTSPLLAAVLGMSALSAIVPSLPIGCRGLCRSPAPVPVVARRGEVDLRRVMVSGLLGLGADHGVV